MKKRLRFLGKTAKAGIGLTVGNYLLKGLGFLTVPIFSRLMDPADYGIYNTFLSYEGILYLFVGFALHSTLKNAKYKFGPDRLDEYTSTVLALTLAAGAGYAAAANLLFPALRPYLSDRTELNLLIAYCWAVSVLYVYQNRRALDFDAKGYLRLSYFNALGSVALSLVLILWVFPERKFLGRIVGTVAPALLAAAWIVARSLRTARPRNVTEYWKYGLKIAVPIIPHGIGLVLLSSFDRIMITAMVGEAESGFYSFAYIVYTIVTVTASSVHTVFENWAFARLAAGERKLLVKRAGTYFMGLAYLTAACMLTGPELIRILGSEKFAPSADLVPPILFGGFFALAYGLPSLIEYYKEKTGYIAAGTLAAAALNILLNAVFIPIYGYRAAAYTTLASYFCYYVFHTFIARRLAGFFIVSPLRSAAGSLFLLTVFVVSVTSQKQIFVRWAFLAAITLPFAIRFLRVLRERKTANAADA